MLAAAADVEMPTRTYTVTTPSGWHLYFRAPAGVTLRNTAGSLGWRVDSRARGGYVVAAGSVRKQGVYRVARRGSIAQLPEWLARGPGTTAGAGVRAVDAAAASTLQRLCARDRGERGACGDDRADVTSTEVHRTIDDGVGYGKRCPRRITR